MASDPSVASAVAASASAAPSSVLTAVVVAAGSSQRMGFDKLFAELAGLPVVAWSLSAFQDCAEVNNIVLITRPEKEAAFRRMAEEFRWSKLGAILPGGAARHLSVWNGLEAIQADARAREGWVAVHDGARPLITPEMIRGCFTLARESGAACCAAPVSDTLKRATADRLISSSVDRTDLWGMQTPQIFAFPVLRAAYERLVSTGEQVTDEASALEALGLSVALFHSSEYNLKITYPPDLRLAGLILAARQ